MDPSISLYYWPIRFRGNIIRLILSEANVTYTDVKDYPSIQSFVFTNPEGKTTPTFAPPVLTVGDNFILSQSAAICQYLARRYGLEPSTLEGSAHALMMYLNCNDILNEITRDGGHYDFWDQGKWDTFVTGRLSQWMSLLDRVLDNKEYFFEMVSYVDFAVFTVLDGLVHDFGMSEYLSSKVPRLWAHYERILKRESVIRVLSEQRAGNVAFCGGQIQKSIESVTINKVL